MARSSRSFAFPKSIVWRVLTVIVVLGEDAVRLTNSVFRSTKRPGGEMSASKRARTVLVLIACVLVISATTMFGQAVNGTLLGTLTDSSGAVVPGAKVSA